MTHVVRGCFESDFDAATGTCAQEVWVPQMSSLPALDIEGAQSIGAACALLWGIAWIFRRIRKFLDQA